MWEKPVGWDKVDMIFRLSHPATHPPDRLDFFGTQIFFQDPNFNPNPIPTQLQPNPKPNSNRTYSQTRVRLCKPCLFSIIDTHPPAHKSLKTASSKKKLAF